MPPSPPPSRHRLRSPPSTTTRTIDDDDGARPSLETRESNPSCATPCSTPPPFATTRSTRSVSRACKPPTRASRALASCPGTPRRRFRRFPPPVTGVSRRRRAPGASAAPTTTRAVEAPHAPRPSRGTAVPTNPPSPFPGGRREW